MRKHWSEVVVEHVEVKPDKLKVNDEVIVKAWVCLGALEPKDVTVQLYYGTLDSRGADYRRGNARYGLLLPRRRRVVCCRE